MKNLLSISLCIILACCLLLSANATIYTTFSWHLVQDSEDPSASSYYYAGSHKVNADDDTPNLTITTFEYIHTLKKGDNVAYYLYQYYWYGSDGSKGSRIELYSGSDGSLIVAVGDERPVPPKE